MVLIVLNNIFFSHKLWFVSCFVRFIDNPNPDITFCNGVSFELPEVDGEIIFICALTGQLLLNKSHQVCIVEGITLERIREDIIICRTYSE